MITDNIKGLFALSSISSQDCLQWNVESLTQTWFIHNLSEYICLQKPTRLTIRPAATVKFYRTTKGRWPSRWVPTLNATHREAVWGSSAQAETVESPLTGDPSLTSTPTELLVAAVPLFGFSRANHKGGWEHRSSSAAVAEHGHSTTKETGNVMTQKEWMNTWVCVLGLRSSALWNLLPTDSWS